MSIKVNAFSTILPAPQTIDKFVVWIPGILDSPMRVSSATLPQSKQGVNEINFTGQPVRIPTKEQYPGTWTCRMTESALGDIAYQISTMKKNQYVIDSKTECVQSFKMINPVIFITDEVTGAVPTFHCILEGAFIESINEVHLDWSQPGTPLQWDITFRYTKISYKHNEG